MHRGAARHVDWPVKRSTVHCRHGLREVAYGKDTVSQQASRERGASRFRSLQKSRHLRPRVRKPGPAPLRDRPRSGSRSSTVSTSTPSSSTREKCRSTPCAKGSAPCLNAPSSSPAISTIVRQGEHRSLRSSVRRGTPPCGRQRAFPSVLPFRLDRIYAAICLSCLMSTMPSRRDGFPTTLRLPPRSTRKPGHDEPVRARQSHLC